MKQTAIEWLQQALMTKEDADNYNQWAFKQAKEMEKEQKGYSEEEVKHIVSEALESALVTVDLEQWFKQFKKK